MTSTMASRLKCLPFGLQHLNLYGKGQRPRKLAVKGEGKSIMFQRHKTRYVLRNCKISLEADDPNVNCGLQI